MTSSVLVNKEPDQKYVRQSDIINPEVLGTPVHIIGAGAIGSCAALALAKIGFKDFTVYDFDSVELHNLPNQMYRAKDIGKPKVEALKQFINEMEGIDIIIHNTKYINQPVAGIVIIALDSMDERIKIWNLMKIRSKKVSLFVDARMGAEVMRLYAFDPRVEANCDFYEQYLYPSSEAESAPCTAKSTMYTALIIGGMIAGQVKKALMNEYKPELGVPSREVIFDVMNCMMIAQR